MIVMDTFADVSGGEVIHCHCTTLVYFGSFLCLPKALLCLTVQHHNFDSAPFGACFQTKLHFTGMLVEHIHGSSALGTVANVSII